MKYLLILVIIVLAIFIFFVRSDTANAATECYGIGASTHENNLTTQSRIGQQYTPDGIIILSSVSVNIWTPTFAPSQTGFYHFQIHETTAGIPNSTIVAGSIVQISASTVPVAAVGTAQAFICGSIPTHQIFTFASPITLNSGQTYAFAMHKTTGDGGSVGYIQGFPDIAPESGLTCTGAGCITHTGWALSDHGGVNYDMVFSLENDLIEPTVRDGKIDGHVLEFRQYLQLDGVTGGFVFVMGLVAILYVLGMRSNVPFVAMSMLNLLLVGVFTLNKTMPEWVLLAVSGIAGLAVVLKIFGNRQQGGSVNE